MATTKVINDLIDLNATDATKSLKMPSGAAYSGTAQDGMVRNDTDGDSQGSASTMQHFNGTDWKNYENLAPVADLTVDFLVVAGGASGGSQYGGGGGAGGLKTTTTYGGSESALGLSLSTPYNVTVGGGGAGVIYTTSPSNNGADSVFDSVTSKGGGYGGYFFGGSTASTGGNSGGSGGGGGMGLTAGVTTAGGIATPTGQGSDGGDGYRGNTGADYQGGGGGGSSAPGQDGSAAASATGGFGGAGSSVSITGTALSYAGGGGGAGSTTGGAGGAGGGGTGTGNSYNGATINGTINTGGGGGGMLPYVSGSLSGSGGLGTVILRYPTADVSSFAVTGTLDTVADTAYPIANLAYYKLNGGSGTTVTDSSGNGNNGVSTSVTYTAGRFGQAAVFNGSSGYITVTGLGITGNSSFTVSTWVKTTSSGLFFFFGNGGLNASFYINVNSNGTITVGEFDFDLYTSTATVNNGGWHHVAFTSDGTTSKLYIDGLESNSATNTFAISADIMELGRGTASYYFPGSLDQVRIFNSALSAGNVTSLYNEGTVVESTDGTDSILQFIGGTGTVTFS